MTEQLTTPAKIEVPAETVKRMYYYLRLTRALEERLVALFRQTKVIGGLYRSLGQEGESEEFFLPNAQKVIAAARGILNY